METGTVALLIWFSKGDPIDRAGFASFQQCNVVASSLYNHYSKTRGTDAGWACIDDRGYRSEYRCLKGHGCLPDYMLARKK